MAKYYLISLDIHLFFYHQESLIPPLWSPAYILCISFWRMKYLGNSILDRWNQVVDLWFVYLNIFSKELVIWTCIISQKISHLAINRTLEESFWKYSGWKKCLHFHFMSTFSNNPLLSLRSTNTPTNFLSIDDMKTIVNATNLPIFFACSSVTFVTRVTKENPIIKPKYVGWWKDSFVDKTLDVKVLSQYLITPITKIWKIFWLHPPLTLVLNKSTLSIATRT